MKANTLASARAVKVADNRTIGSNLLLQRFLAVSETGDLSLDDVLKYKLSPYPTSFFEAKHLLRKADKAQFLDDVKNQVT